MSWWQNEPPPDNICGSACQSLGCDSGLGALPSSSGPSLGWEARRTRLSTSECQGPRTASCVPLPSLSHSPEAPVAGSSQARSSAPGQPVSQGDRPPVVTASTQLCRAPSHQTQKGSPDQCHWRQERVITHCSPSIAPYRPHTASTFVRQTAGKPGLLGPHTREQAQGFSQAPSWKKGTKLEEGAPGRPRPLHTTPAGPARAGSARTGPHPQAGPRSPLGPLLPPERGQPLPVWEHTPTSEHVAQGKNKHFLEAKVGEKS